MPYILYHIKGFLCSFIRRHKNKHVSLHAVVNKQQRYLIQISKTSYTCYGKEPEEKEVNKNKELIPIQVGTSLFLAFRITKCIENLSGYCLLNQL